MSETPKAGNPRKPVTLNRLRDMYTRGEKIAMLTCYDTSFAAHYGEAGVDCVLVGDSLGMVMQGHASTLPVTLQDIAYHVDCVARGLRRGGASPWLIGDLPFGSYHGSHEQAMASATALMQAGAQMVKLEGAGWATDTVRFLVERGVPVCAHLGLTPQSVHALGGYRVQGRAPEAAAALVRDARSLEDAGAAMLVLELMPSAVARDVTAALHIPTIGIGAGAGCSGQVLVMHDMLGVTPGQQPRFVHNFLEETGTVQKAFAQYVADVKGGRFPDEARHSY